MRPIRDILQAIGEAVKREILRGANENGKYSLRPNSPLAASLWVEVSQTWGAARHIAGYTANLALTLYAKVYAQWLDIGRRPFHQESADTCHYSIHQKLGL
jgi:hypothetical protein